MRKYCQQCGDAIETDDYYAFIRTKYCKRCAPDVRRRQQAEWARELRRVTREQNALTRQLCEAQQQEIARLREMVTRQRERVRKLEEDMGK